MSRKEPRDVTEIIRDILASFRRETIVQGTMYCRANLNYKYYQKRYVDPLIFHGFIEMEKRGKRRYPVIHYTLTNRGQRLLLALGGKP